MAHWPTRGLRTGVASSRLVLVPWWWLRVPLNPAPMHRPKPVYPLHACTLWWQLRQSGWGAVLRRPTLLWEGNVPARGSGVAQSPAERSANFGRLQGGLERMFRPPCCALPYSGLFGGWGCKKSDWTDASFLSRFHILTGEVRTR